jgi:hypothetical protein
MKSVDTKKKIGSDRTRKSSQLSKLKLPALPSGIPEFPPVLLKRGKQYERAREIYSAICFALEAYDVLHQQIDCTIILMATTNYKIYEDCVEIALNPRKRFIEEAKSHTAKDENGAIQKTLLPHPSLKLMKESEEGFRNAMNCLGLTVAKRASILGTLSLYQNIHGNSNVESDPFAKYFVQTEMEDI